MGSSHRACEAQPECKAQQAHPGRQCEYLAKMQEQYIAQAAHRALTDVRVRLRGRALAMPVEGLGWMRLLATSTTSLPENFFSSSLTRRGCTFWKAFSSR